MTCSVARADTVRGWAIGLNDVCRVMEARASLAAMSSASPPLPDAGTAGLTPIALSGFIAEDAER